MFVKPYGGPRLYRKASNSGPGIVHQYLLPGGRQPPKDQALWKTSGPYKPSQNRVSGLSSSSSSLSAIGKGLSEAERRPSTKVCHISTSGAL